MKTDECIHCDHLTATVEAAHEQALVALTGGAAPLDAVAWVAAHLGAIERVVHPALRRHCTGVGDALQEQERVDRALQRALRRLEQVAAGDALAARIDVTVATNDVVSLLAGHAAGEHLLVDTLARTIGPDATAAIAARYDRAVANGPTRPHPHAPRAHGRLAALVFVVERMRDHVMDVVDSRHVPIPRRRPARREPGRWGHYLLGTIPQQGPQQGPEQPAEQPPA